MISVPFQRCWLVEAGELVQISSDNVPSQQGS